MVLSTKYKKFLYENPTKFVKLFCTNLIYTTFAPILIVKPKHNMKLLKIIALLIALVSAPVLYTSCGNGAEKDANPLADSLQGENNKKDGQLSEKEAAIQEFVTTFNEIQANLNEIKEKEKIVTNSSK